MDEAFRYELGTMAKLHTEVFPMLIISRGYWENMEYPMQKVEYYIVKGERGTKFISVLEIKETKTVDGVAIP